MPEVNDVIKAGNSVGGDAASIAGAAATGASIGSIIPGVGTAIGAALGAAFAGISKLFGGSGATPRTINYYVYRTTWDGHTGGEWFSRFYDATGTFGRRYDSDADIAAAQQQRNPGMNPIFNSLIIETKEEYPIEFAGKPGYDAKFYRMIKAGQFDELKNWKVCMGWDQSVVVTLGSIPGLLTALEQIRRSLGDGSLADALPSGSSSTSEPKQASMKWLPIVLIFGVILGGIAYAFNIGGTRK